MHWQEHAGRAVQSRAKPILSCRHEHYMAFGLLHTTVVTIPDRKIQVLLLGSGFVTLFTYKKPIASKLSVLKA